MQLPYWRRKTEKEKLGIIPCNSGVFPRLVQVPAEEETYMLAEELILHFISKVFQRLFCEGKISDPRNEKRGYRCRCVV